MTSVVVRFIGGPVVPSGKYYTLYTMIVSYLSPLHTALPRAIRLMSDMRRNTPSFVDTCISRMPITCPQTSFYLESSVLLSSCFLMQSSHAVFQEGGHATTYMGVQIHA